MPCTQRVILRVTVQIAAAFSVDAVHASGAAAAAMVAVPLRSKKQTQTDEGLLREAAAVVQLLG